MFEQTIGWIGNILFFVSAILLSKKNVVGWYGQFFANILYVWQSFLLNNVSLLWLSVILGVVNIYGAWEWSRKNNKNQNIMEQRHAKSVIDFYDIDHN